MLVSFLSLWLKGMNYGIDFKGGYILEVRMLETPDVSALRDKLSNLSLGEVSIQKFGTENDLLIKLEKGEADSKNASSTGNEKQSGAGLIEGEDECIKMVKNVLGEKNIYKKVESIGPKVGEELISNAVSAVVFSLIAMFIYIMLRFKWQFGVCALVALLHDCSLVFGMFSIFPMEFNEMSITAILLTSSYSINDTVVIFDRIRENLKKTSEVNINEVINTSINETLSRTTLTAATTMLAVLSLIFFGGKVLSAFSLPILIGIVIGTFSSIFVAAPLLSFMGVSFLNKHGKKAQANDG
jgi:preprotein translocase subunit SecF